ncbi:MAG: HepT-like ribonuclease domain-containing protein [Pseudomonadota bacterium]
MRGDRERLFDIPDAIEKIEERAAVGQAEFMEDELIQVWCVHHIQIIGEAAANISLSIRDRYSHIPWQDIIAMRNVLVHQYFGIDYQEIWNAVNVDIPLLKDHIEGILYDFV